MFWRFDFFVRLFFLWKGCLVFLFFMASLFCNRKVCMRRAVFIYRVEGLFVCVYMFLSVCICLCLCVSLCLCVYVYLVLCMSMSVCFWFVF